MIRSLNTDIRYRDVIDNKAGGNVAADGGGDNGADDNWGWEQWTGTFRRARLLNELKEEIENKKHNHMMACQYYAGLDRLEQVARDRHSKYTDEDNQEG